jgi:uncharacterized membrane protein (DUF441 family)
MSVLATIVDWSALGQTVIAALLAGVGVAFSFSLGILGAARLTDSSQELGLFGTIGYGMLAFTGIAATLAAVAFGIVVMATS